MTSTFIDDPFIGRVLESKYELLECLGEGSMGRVYRGRRTLIGDEVAIKILHQKYVKEVAALERFRREAQAAARLHHPNVVTIYDYGEALSDDAPAFIVMELVPGDSLRHLLLREGRLMPERAVSLMRDICAGVGAAHRNGVIHRDLKPDNIMVLPPGLVSEAEAAKVVDFGIAKLRDIADVKTLTETGMIIGTPYYMSPEQCRADPLDSRSDVYSLGAMLYEMLTGSPPFTANTFTGIIAKHLTEQAPRLPPSLEAAPQLDYVVNRTLSKDPGMRQADATTLARELQAAVTQIGGRIGTPGVPQELHNQVPPTRPIAALSNPPHATTKIPSNEHSTNEHSTNEHSTNAGTGNSSSRAWTFIVLAGAGLVLLAGVIIAVLMWQDKKDSNRLAESPGQLRNANANAPSNKNQNDISSETLPTAANTNNSEGDAGASTGDSGKTAEMIIVKGALLTDSDIEGIFPSDLRNLRNAIYARHGRVFDAPALQRYFNSRPWYKPRNNYTDADLTPNDQANLALIKRAESATLDPGTESSKREILTTVNQWADALRRHDLDAHMNYYADSLDFYYRRGNTSADFVRADRERAFTRFSKLNVKLTDITIMLDPSNERTSVTFDKSWYFEGEKPFSGSVRQLLLLAKKKDGWRIIGEREQ